MDEDEVAGQQASKDEVEVKGGGFEVGKKDSQGDRREQDSDEECGAMLVMKVVAGFEALLLGECGVGEPDIHQTGIHQAIGGVEHPYGYGDGEDGRCEEMDVVRGGDEPGPKGGDGRGIEGEKVPESEGGVGCLWFGVGALVELLGLDGGRGGHVSILGL